MLVKGATVRWLTLGVSSLKLQSLVYISLIYCRWIITFSCIHTCLCILLHEFLQQFVSLKKSWLSTSYTRYLVLSHFRDLVRTLLTSIPRDAVKIWMGYKSVGSYPNLPAVINYKPIRYFKCHYFSSVWPYIHLSFLSESPWYVCVSQKGEKCEFW